MPESYDESELNRKHKEEEIKTFKARRHLYVGGFLIVLAVLLYLLGQVLNILSMPVAIIVWATVIVFCLRGPVNYLAERGVPRILGTTIAFIGMFLGLGLLGWLLFSPELGLGAQFQSLVQGLPNQIYALSGLWDDFYSQYSYILQDAQVNEWMNQAFSSVGTWFSDMATLSAEGAVQIGSGIASGFMIIAFALVVAFWVLMELPLMGAELKRLVGPKYQDDLNILYITGTRVMGGYIKGTLLQCLLIGLFCGIGYAIMGIPSAAALGVITGLLNIIPVVGPWLGGGMAALVGIFVSPVVAFFAVVYTVAVQQIIYTFVSPKIMGNSVDVHPALVIIAMMAGSGIGYAMSGFGGSVVGMLASIPAVAVIKSLFVYYFEQRTGRIIVAEDGFLFKGNPAGTKVNPVADATGEFFVPETGSSGLKHRKH